MRKFFEVLFYSVLQFTFSLVLSLRSVGRATGGDRGDLLDLVGVILGLPLGILPFGPIVLPLNSLLWGTGLFYFWRHASQQPRPWWPGITLKAITWLLFLWIVIDLIFMIT